MRGTGRDRLAEVFERDVILTPLDDPGVPRRVLLPISSGTSGPAFQLAATEGEVAVERSTVCEAARLSVPLLMLTP
ncbi:hypothetical protein GCM10010431_54430 [Streptomyces kunmingensis]